MIKKITVKLTKKELDFIIEALAHYSAVVKHGPGPWSENCSKYSAIDELRFKLNEQL